MSGALAGALGGAGLLVLAGLLWRRRGAAAVDRSWSLSLAVRREQHHRTTGSPGALEAAPDAGGATIRSDDAGGEGIRDGGDSAA